VYPNHPQKQLLKRWMGLTRYAYNAVVRWSQYRRFYTKNSYIGPLQRVWIKPQPIKDKLKLYADVHVGKDVNELEDKKLQKSCVWGERKFIRTVVRIGMLLQGTHGKVPANIIDEAIDEALTARDNIINHNVGSNTNQQSSSLSFRSRKDLRQTITIRAQNFSRSTWNRFYVTHLHNSSMYTLHRHKPTTIDNNKRALWPLHFEKKRKNNKWPIPHKISCDGKLTYFRQTNEWKFAWIYETEKKLHETQVDGSIYAVSIDPGVRTPFTWYSPTKGVGKIGEHDIGKIVRLCIHMDGLSSKKDKLASSTSKRKKKKALRVDKAIFRMQRKIKHLQNEIHRKTIKFLTDEFDVVIIPPFEVSNMVNRKTRKITRKTVRKMLCWSHYNFRQRLISKAEEKGIHVIIQNEAYTSKTCSCCGNIQKIGGSEVFNCQNGRTIMDRDENGARGIFLRALLDGALILSGDHAGNNSNT